MLLGEAIPESEQRSGDLFGRDREGKAEIVGRARDQRGEGAAEYSVAVPELIANRDAGFGVLAIDLGYLDGRHRYSAGRREARDISAAINWLDSRSERLAGVWAFSAGAHAALIAAADDRRIPWVISDGGFASGEAQLRRTASANVKVLPPSGLPLMAAMVSLFSGDRPIDLLTVPWPGTPVLIVHGRDDQVVSLDAAHAIRAYTGGELLLLPDVEHTQAYRMAPAAYQAAAMAFIQRVSAGAGSKQAGASTSAPER